MDTQPSRPFLVLSLDGGGSKGVFSLGVLRELEAMLGAAIHERFSLIYGTSTGAIIGSLLALGESAASVSSKYFKLIPDVMKYRRRKTRTTALREQAREVFGDRRFDSFLTGVGIVSTHFDYRRPLIFKTAPEQAHGRRESFVSGFGCLIADAVISSCAAFPYFERCLVNTENHGAPQLIDGGFVANNPALFALADALQAYQVPRARIRLLSVGVGTYPQPRRFWDPLRRLWPFEIFELVLEANSNTTENIRSLFFSDIAAVRVNDSFSERRYATHLLESDLATLRKLEDLGRESFGKQERALRQLLLE